MKYTKGMTLETAKEELKKVSNEIKGLKKKNEFSKRKSNLDCLRKLFKKYHGGRFTMNKVRWKNGKHIYGDAQDFYNLMMKEAWLKGFIVCAIHGDGNCVEDVE